MMLIADTYKLQHGWAKHFGFERAQTVGLMTLRPSQRHSKTMSPRMNTRLSRLCTHAWNVFPVKKMNEWGLQSFWAEKKGELFWNPSREEFIEAPVPNHGKSRTFWKPGITQQKLKHGGHKRQLNQKSSHGLRAPAKECEASELKKRSPFIVYLLCTSRNEPHHYLGFHDSVNLAGQGGGQKLRPSKPLSAQWCCCSGCWSSAHPCWGCSTKIRQPTVKGAWPHRCYQNFFSTLWSSSDQRILACAPGIFIITCRLWLL